MRVSPFEKEYATIDGATKLKAEWCKQFRLAHSVVRNRMKRLGLSFEEALTYRPVRSSWWTDGAVTINGETRSPADWAKDSGVTYHTYHNRIYRGMRMEDALTRPARSMIIAKVLTVDGETHTIAEWCSIKGISLQSAINAYRATGNLRFSILTAKEKQEYLKDHVVPGQSRQTMWLEEQLSLNPTPEVIDMCTNCPRKDCDRTIVYCLNVKHAMEGTI